MKSLKFKIATMLGTFFYVGFCPIAPGTAGSLASTIITYFLPTNLWYFNIFMIAILLISGVIFSATVETTLQIKDPTWMVIDEVLGMYLTLFWLPKTFCAYSIAFILFRFFDIAKIYPINKIEDIQAPGWGIMLDDVMAAVYANAILIILLKINVI